MATTSPEPRAETEDSGEISIPGWAILFLAIPVALVLGFVGGDSLKMLVAATAGVLAVLGIFLVPVSTPIKLVFFLISLTFLQRMFGYFKVGEVRGLNVGNLLLAGAFGYWVLNGLRTGRWYRPSPIDFSLVVAVVVIPIFSVFYSLAFRANPAYSSNEVFSWYKQWVTPFIYFVLLCQTLESRKDIRLLLYLVIGLVALGILQSLPEALRFTSWHESRAEGFVQQANDFAALLACTSPFLLLMVFLPGQRPAVRIAAFLVLGGLGLALLTTYSRAGYLGFGLAVAGTVWAAYRGTGRIPLSTPTLVVGGLCLLPLLAAPQLLDYVTQRFEVKSYQRAKRKSYSKFNVLNQYSGDRLELWKGAINMAEDNPVFGVGFHAFEIELPNYSHRDVMNYPHNLFLGALAEGGIVWLTALLLFLWKLLSILRENWGLALDEKDFMGQVICGGALVSFAVMFWIALSNDFFNPGPKTTIFWVTMAGAVKYGFLPRRGSIAPGTVRAGGA